ncbi:MAG: DNA polymerase III [Candidatus Levybacteria bacterium]|nr:DNA polymerase III [Candidatus Levybacteria bacterium]
MTNKEIAKLFRAVAASYSIKNEKKFRFQIIAYQKAADAVDGLTTQLEDLYKEGELEEIPGIGATIKGRLEELFKKGKVKHFEDVMKGIPPSVFVLMEIPSIGPKKAFRISSHFHIKNPQTCINEVEKLAKSGKIAKLEGFGEKSEADILRAISEFKEGKGKTTRILLSYAGEVADQILDYLKKFEYVKDAAPLGSLRRMKPLVGDIDIAATTTKPKQLIEHFIKYKRVDRIIEKGPTTASILTTAGNQIDLMVLSPKKWGSLLQHFTGSKDHNVALREYALKKSLSLSEKGIKNLKTGKMNEFSKEEEFYKSLGLSWIPPEMRENTGEIELALKNKLPKIVELGNIKGDFHIHTSFPVEPSHDLGKNSISEMLQKAKELGYEYLGFSEHNPSQSKHTKQEIIDLILKRNEEVERQNNLHGVKTFKLMETDILPNGELALPEEALEKLDATIVSIHSVFKMGRTEMTKRVLTGLSHPKAKILAHPTGRLLNERYGYDLNFDEIFEFCKKNNKALEINAYPNRLDLYDELIRKAVDGKVLLSIDTDSHAVYQMELMRYGVAQARRGWATKSDIINALSYDEVKKWFSL